LKAVGEEIASRTLLEFENIEAWDISLKNQLNRMKKMATASPVKTEEKGLILYCLTIFKDGE